jgi:hypothetical protein
LGVWARAEVAALTRTTRTVRHCIVMLLPSHVGLRLYRGTVKLSTPSWAVPDVLHFQTLRKNRDRRLGFFRIYLLRMRRMDTGENPNRSSFYNAGLVHT